MSENYREQHPLLSEDLSDEEHKPLDPVHRSSPITFRGYAKNTAKGATNIIKTWPDIISSLLPYLWMMLALSGIITFVFYNTVTVALLPAYAKALQQLNFQSDVYIPNGVYMPVIVNSDEETRSNEYYPYIQIIARQYRNYTFCLIYLFNDTNKNKEDFNLEVERPITTGRRPKFVNRVIIRKVFLSKYLDSSPIGYIWRKLPPSHLEFLVRAVAIWQKGGVAFNPIILTPRSPNSNYIKKLHSFLANYSSVVEQPKLDFKKQKPKKRVNNIQDIIDNDDDEDLSKDNMVGEESKLVLNIDAKVPYNISDLETNNDAVWESLNPFNKNETKVEKKINYDFLAKNPKNHTTNHSSLFVPMFLEFLFHPKLLDTNTVENVEPVKNENVIEYHSTKIFNELDTKYLEKNSYHVLKENSSHEVAKYFYPNNMLNLTNNYTMIIDLKGYFIATRTHCHAFLGMLFAKSGYLEDSRSVRDLIIRELSTFCKGPVSMCDVIDIIF